MQVEQMVITSRLDFLFETSKDLSLGFTSIHVIKNRSRIRIRSKIVGLKRNLENENAGRRSWWRRKSKTDTTLQHSDERKYKNGVKKVFKVTDKNKQYRCTSRDVAGQGETRREKNNYYRETFSDWVITHSKFNERTYALRMSTFRSWSSKLWLVLFVFMCLFFFVFVFFLLISFLQYIIHGQTHAVDHSSNSLSYANRKISTEKLQSHMKTKIEQTANKEMSKNKKKSKQMRSRQRLMVNTRHIEAVQFINYLFLKFICLEIIFVFPKFFFFIIWDSTLHSYSLQNHNNKKKRPSCDR